MTPHRRGRPLEPEEADRGEALVALLEGAGLSGSLLEEERSPLGPNDA